MIKSPVSVSLRHQKTLEFQMLDILYLVGGAAFFVISVLYTTACDHL